MKKNIVIGFLLMGIFSLSLCGCGEELSTQPTTEQTASSKETETEQVQDVAKEETKEEAKEETKEDTKEETAEVEEKEDAVGATTLTYCGHAGIKIKSSDGRVIYIDPYYYKGDYSEEADILLVTHGHDDHKPARNVKVKEGGLTITWKEAHPDENTYLSGDFDGIEIEAVPAANSNHDIKYNCGYIVTVDGIKVYHAADTSMLDSMAELKDKEIDYALYPIDGEFNMDATEATEVANLVGAKHNIPIHEFDKDGQPKKSEKFLPEGRLVLEYGETVELSK